LAPEIAGWFPNHYGRYFEPFLGSGAVFFQLRPSQAILSDSNTELVNAYQVVQYECESVIEWLRGRGQSESEYYRIREMDATCRVERAGRLIYLNRVGFNGVWRVNRKGRYNVPYGHRPRKDLVEAEKLREASALLRGCLIVSGDFGDLLEYATRGDVVYADPPYTVKHNNNGFARYNEALFPWSEQERLARMARDLADRGVRVIVSNADHDSVRDLYADGKEVRLRRRSTVAADVRRRSEVSESLFMLSE
jgi:DNA adenine methylase